MINGLRKYTYTISALAIACFFLVPDPTLAIIGALLLQTLAFIVIAGKSLPDGIMLTGITILLLGVLPADHPLIRGEFYGSVKQSLVLAGAGIIVVSLLMIMWQLKKRP
jgi:hypothetical protein